MLKKASARRKYKQWTQPVITSYPSTNGFSKPVLSNTLMFLKKQNRKIPAEGECVTACVQDCLLTCCNVPWVCVKERQIKKGQWVGEWKVRTEENEQWKQAEGEQTGELAEQRQKAWKVLHVCWFPALSGPCQPVIYGTETGSSLLCQLCIVTTDS